MRSSDSDWPRPADSAISSASTATRSGVAAVVVVGGADQRHAIPRDHEEHPPVGLAPSAAAPRRQRGHHQMHAFGQTAPVAPRFGCSRPLPGGLDDLPGEDLARMSPLRTSCTVAPHTCPPDSYQPGQSAMIHAHRTCIHRARDQFQHQPRIVGLRIAVGEAAFQACLDPGTEIVPANSTRSKCRW